MSGAQRNDHVLFSFENVLSIFFVIVADSLINEGHRRIFQTFGRSHFTSTDPDLVGAGIGGGGGGGALALYLDS